VRRGQPAAGPRDKAAHCGGAWVREAATAHAAKEAGREGADGFVLTCQSLPVSESLTADYDA
jgi:translation elongation factor EF-Ts